MAKIVLGMGASHGPLLSTPPEQWDLRAAADRENKTHWYRGRTYDYEALLKERAPGFAEQVTVEVRRERYDRCRKAMEALSAKFTETGPEAVVIVGNDQREFFEEDLTPAITIFRGTEIKNVQHLHERSPGLNIAEVGNAPREGAIYPGAPELADHILKSLAEDDFDIAQSSSIPKSSSRRGIPHAYGFLYHSILGDAPPPSVPVILNVHYPFNQPKVHRCLKLGKALERAIQSFNGCDRVAVMASGGLSHFVIDEELDQKVCTPWPAMTKTPWRSCRRTVQGGHGGDQELAAGDRGDERGGPHLSIRSTMCRVTAPRREPGTRWRSCIGSKRIGAN